MPGGGAGSGPEAVPVSDAEADVLFRGLADSRGLLVAISGGPDSTALLILIARWRSRLAAPPPVLAVTVDHGLRPGSAGEAAAVKRFAASLGIVHRTRRWTGPRPETGLPAAARAARYRMLAEAAVAAGASHLLTAHTLDDQAETVLMRLLRGSGPAGLAGMAPQVALDRATGVPLAGAGTADDIWLVRPLLALPKARLIATCAGAGLAHALDPSNADPRFTRPRLRRLFAALGPEGLSMARLSLLAARARRGEAALEWAVDRAEASVRLPGVGAWNHDVAALCALPDEIGLRLLRRAVEALGHEGPVELGKLETVYRDLVGAAAGTGRWRRTIAGALVTLARGRLSVAPAPGRRMARPAGRIFTTANAVSADSLGMTETRTYIALQEHGGALPPAPMPAAPTPSAPTAAADEQTGSAPRAGTRGTAGSVPATSMKDTG